MANLIPRIVEVTDVFGAVHDGAELAFVNAWYIEHDVLHAFWQWRLAALCWYSSVFLKKKSCFLRRMELLSFCNVRKGDITLYVAFLFILWYEAKDVAP